MEGPLRGCVSFSNRVGSRNVTAEDAEDFAKARRGDATRELGSTNTPDLSKNPIPNR